MNARQKAKHFKRLYEEALPKKPYPVIYKTILPKHYRIEQFIDTKTVFYTENKQELLKTLIENKILKELRPLIYENIIVEKEAYYDAFRVSLDIWLKGEKNE